MPIGKPPHSDVRHRRPDDCRIHDHYELGILVVAVEALKKPARKFETLDSALSFACANISVSRQEIVRKSQLWLAFKSQTRITDFA